MNYNLNYYPDPGIAFDISKMLFVKLNSPSIWHSAFSTLDSNNNEIKFIQMRADTLPNPPSELLLFVYLPPNKNVTLLANTISKLIYKEFDAFSITTLIDYFANVKQIQKEIFTYYLGDYPLNSTDLERSIRLNKNIPERLKILLFGFLLNPSFYISSLCEIFDKYYCIITNRWIFESPNNIPSTFIDHIIEKTYSEQKNELKNLHDSTISFSLCFSTPLFLLRNFTTHSPFLITTNNTIQHMLEHTELSITTSLINSTTALSDKSRIAIIDYIISNPNITLHQIAEALHLPNSTITHHLSQLKKANMVSSSRHGRTVLYSYNPQGFQNIFNALKKLEKGGNI